MVAQRGGQALMTIFSSSDHLRTAALLEAWLTVPVSASAHRHEKPLHITAYLPLPTIRWLRRSLQEASASAEEESSTYVKELHAALLGGGSTRLEIHDVYQRLNPPVESHLQLTDKHLIDSGFMAVRRDLNKLQKS